MMTLNMIIISFKMTKPYSSCKQHQPSTHHLSLLCFVLKFEDICLLTVRQLCEANLSCSWNYCLI